MVLCDWCDLMCAEECDLMCAEECDLMCDLEAEESSRNTYRAQLYSLKADTRTISEDDGQRCHSPKKHIAILLRL